MNFLRRLILAGLISTVLCLAFSGYQGWNEQHCVNRAKAAFARADYAQAWMAARQALEHNSSNVAAWLILADTADRCHLAQAVPLRQRVAALQPDVPDHQIRLANSAVRLASPALARAVLDSMESRPNAQANFHSAAASVAMIGGNLRAAQRHLAAATADNPQAEDIHNLAVLQLADRDPAMQEAARNALENMSTQPERRVEVLRSLVADALRQGNLPRALRFSAPLEGEPAVEFQDRLWHLEILTEMSSPGAAEFLHRMREHAATNSSFIYQLGNWMVMRGLATEAITWIDGLPSIRASARSTRLLRAECFIALEHWRDAERSLRDENWSEYDFLRVALLSLALRHQGEFEAARANWQKAIRGALPKVEDLRELVQRAASWDWAAETEALLNEMVVEYPRDRWAAQILQETYYIDGSTAKLGRLFAILCKQHPDDPIAKNNLAITSLLLQADLESAHQLALRAFLDAPALSGVVSTYAYSLFSQGQPAAALEILAALPEAELKKPGAAAYYGLLLAVNGQFEKAAVFLGIADQGPLLPEECQLVAGAYGFLRNSQPEQPEQPEH